MANVHCAVRLWATDRRTIKIGISYKLSFTNSVIIIQRIEILMLLKKVNCDNHIHLNIPQFLRENIENNIFRNLKKIVRFHKI